MLSSFDTIPERNRQPDRIAIPVWRASIAVLTRDKIIPVFPVIEYWEIPTGALNTSAVYEVRDFLSPRPRRGATPHSGCHQGCHDATAKLLVVHAIQKR